MGRQLRGCFISPPSRVGATLAAALAAAGTVAVTAALAAPGGARSAGYEDQWGGDVGRPTVHPYPRLEAEAEVLSAPDGGYAQFVRISVGPDGDARVAWEEDRDGDNAVYMLRWARNRWGETQRLSAPGVVAAWPDVVALADGRAIAAWVELAPATSPPPTPAPGGPPALTGWRPEGRLAVSLCSPDGCEAVSLPFLPLRGTPDRAPRLAWDGRGGFWLVWERWVEAHVEVWAAHRWDSGRWEGPAKIAGSKDAPAYRPAVVVSRGTPWMSWDSSTPDGGYEVYACRLAIEQEEEDRGTVARDAHATIEYVVAPSPVVNVSASPRTADYRPALAPDGRGGAWVTWTAREVGGGRSGLALVHLDGQGARSERLPLRLVEEEVMDAAVLADATGNPWMAWSRRRPLRRVDLVLGRPSEAEGAWPFLAEVATGFLRDSFKERPYLTAGPDGTLWAAWAKGRVECVRLPAERWTGGASSGSLPPGTPPARGAPEAFLRAGEKPAMRPSAILDGKTLLAFWGDLHASTEHSDGRGPVDARLLYGRDVYGYDFQAVTDDEPDLSQSEWMLTQIATDLFDEPGRHIAFPGFECDPREEDVSLGHRNVVGFREGQRLFHFGAPTAPAGTAGAPASSAASAAGDPASDRARILAPLLAFAEGFDGAWIVHHLAQQYAPVDWTSFSEPGHPVAEILSAHGRFEEPAMTFEEVDGGPPYLPVAGHFAVDGLAAGHHFGFVGSSDSHHAFRYSVHRAGLAGAWAERLDRPSVRDAILSRRTFAATDPGQWIWVVAEVEEAGKKRTVPMGAAVPVGPGAKLRLRVRAGPETPGAALEIIVSGAKVAELAAPFDGREVTWNDPLPVRPGTYYYVRWKGPGDRRSWASPIRVLQ